MGAEMAKQPNVILIMTDQQRWDTLSCAKGGWAPTPNIDRLANEGVNFEQCYCASPSCVPSRASFFNLKYPSQLNVMKNGDSWSTSWVEQFKNAGYRTLNIGKMHTQPLDSPCGFNQRFIVENKDRFFAPRFYDDWDKHLKQRGIKAPNRNSYKQRDDYEMAMGAFLWELPTELHWDYFVSQTAQWVIEEHDDKPLFMQIGFPGPHTPYDPPEEYLQFVDQNKIPFAESYDENNDIPPHLDYRQIMLKGNHGGVRWHAHPDKKQQLKLRTYYAENVAMIDEQVGKIIKTLDKKGLLEDSIVIFTSDHGDTLADHGQIQKWTMYDCITRVPAIVWAPGILPKGQRVNTLIQQMDLVPMIFDLAGLKLDDIGEARSAMDVVENNNVGREVVFSEHGRCNMLPNIEKMIMVRTKLWKLVDYPNRDYGELYDLEKDPGEMFNLWQDVRYRTQRKELEEHSELYQKM